MSVSREEPLATTQPLEKVDYEIEGSTSRMVDGDLLRHDLFPELPTFTTRHVYRFIRDGRKASDDRLRTLGGRQFAYINLLPAKGHAIIVPERWTIEMFCKHFDVTRPPPAPLSPAKSPSTVTILQRPSPAKTPPVLPPTVNPPPPTSQQVTVPKSTVFPPPELRRREPAVRSEESVDNPELKPGVPNTQDPNRLEDTPANREMWNTVADQYLKHLKYKLLRMAAQQGVPPEEIEQFEQEQLARFSAEQDPSPPLIDGPKPGTSTESEVMTPSTSQPRMSAQIQPPSTVSIVSNNTSSVAVSNPPTSTAPVTAPQSTPTSSAVVAQQIPAGPFLEWTRSRADGSMADVNSGHLIELLESQFAHIADTIGTIAHRQDEKIFKLGEGLEQAQEANVALTEQIVDVRSVVQFNHREATAKSDRIEATLKANQDQILAAIAGRAPDPPRVSLASTTATSVSTSGNLSQTLQRNRQRLLHQAPGADGGVFGGLPDLGLLTPRTQAMPIYTQNLPNAPYFTGTDKTTFSEWFKLFLRHLPNFNVLPEQQQWDHITLRLRGSPQKLWMSFESDDGMSIEQAIDKMAAMYDEKKNQVDKVNILYNTRKGPKQSVRDYVVDKIAYARDKFPAGVLKSVGGERMLEHAVLNGLPEEYRKTLYRYRTSGTVEELLDDVIQIEREAERTNQEQRFRNFQNNSNNRRNGVQSVESTSNVMAIQEKSKFPDELEDLRRTLEEMNKPLKTESAKGIKVVIIRGKKYTASGFRGLCQLLDRCFCCGGSHRANDCKRRNNPIFPRPPGWTDRRGKIYDKDKSLLTKPDAPFQTKNDQRPRQRDDPKIGEIAENLDDQWLDLSSDEANTGEVVEPESYLESLAAEGLTFDDPDIRPLVEGENSSDWEDAYDVGIASMEILPSQDCLSINRLDVLPIVDLDNVQNDPKFRMTPDMVKIVAPPRHGEIPIKWDLPTGGTQFDNKNVHSTQKENGKSQLPTHEKISSETKKVTISTQYEITDVGTLTTSLDETVCTSPIPAEEGEWWTPGEFIPQEQYRQGEIPIHWQSEDSEEFLEAYSREQVLVSACEESVPSEKKNEKTSERVNVDRETGIDPKTGDPIEENFYPEPVNLDPVYSRQYILIHANGHRLIALLDTGACVNFVSTKVYQRFFSHLPLRQRKIHQLWGVTDRDRERGSDTQGIVQWRLYFGGKMVNTNFLVGDSHDDGCVIMGLNWMDMLQVNIGYDNRKNRVVYMDNQIVPSCIKCNNRLCIVRSTQIANRPTQFPKVEAQATAFVPIPSEYPEGTCLLVESGFTYSGLAITNLITTVQGREILLPIHNLTTEVCQIIPSKVQITTEIIREESVSTIDDADPLAKLLSIASATEVDEKSDISDPPEKIKAKPSTTTYDPDKGIAELKAKINARKKAGIKIPDYPGVDWSRSNLSVEELEIVKLALVEVQEMFAKNKDDMGDMKGYDHPIDVQGKPPVAQPLRALPIQKRPIVCEEVNRMLKAGVIRPSKSPWSSPIVLIRKKDDSWRFCIDYRKVNELTKKDKHPLPRIDEMLDMLGQGKYFSSVDLMSGYWQINMDKESIETTAFTCAEGHYEFLKMPFGLTNAPATFQRAMQCILAGLCFKICLIYLDDVIIFSPNFWQHLYDILCVLITLMTAGVKLSGKKCEFFKFSIDFLGHVISASGIGTSPKKIEAITKALVPTNEKQLRSFLGLTGYYRRFCRNYAILANPLYGMLAKRAPGTTFQAVWGKPQEDAYNALKKNLTSPPILAYPDVNKIFHLYTDASMDGIGNILMQEDEKKEQRVIAYGSRTYRDSEKNYHMPNKEALSVVYAFRSHRHYLLGSKTILITDCSCLVPLFTSKVLRSIIPEGQIFRWMLILQEYDYEVVHLAGKRVPHADAVSRLPIAHGPPPPEDEDFDDDSRMVYSLDEVQIFIIEINALRRSARTNPALENPSDVETENPNPELSYSEEPDSESTQEDERNEDPDDLLHDDSHSDKAESVVSDDSPHLKTAEKEKPWKLKTMPEQLKVVLDFPMPWKADDLRKGQDTDAAFGPMAQYLRDHIENLAWSTLLKNWIPKKHHEYFLHHDLLYHWTVKKIRNGDNVYQFQICVPHTFRLILLEQFHTTAWSCHQPLDAMLAKMSKKYYWPAMVADTRNFVETCVPCQMYKLGPGTTIPLKPIRIVAPFYMLGIDVLTPHQGQITTRGNKHILVIQDYFTKWVIAIATPDQTASTILKVLIEHVFSQHGIPRIILSDNGPCFTANQFRLSLQELGITHRFAAPYHQQTNGMVERWNRSLMTMLRTLLQSHVEDWDEYLQMACFAYRTTPHSSTGMTPFELIYGREPVFPRDAMFSNTQKVYSNNDFTYMRRLICEMKKNWKLASDRLEEAQRTYKEQYDKKAKVRIFEKGQLVIRISPDMLGSKQIPSKFHAYFDFLFRVLEDLGSNLRVEKVLPPKIKPIIIPKQFCKIFRGTERDYSDMQEGLQVPPVEWTHLNIFPKKSRAQQTEATPDVPDEDENSICPNCKKDYESTQDQGWIQCDRCHKWFHFACVGLQEAPTTRNWYCDPCKKARAVPNSGN